VVNENIILGKTMTKESDDVNRAIEWAAAEYKFVVQLKEELAKIQTESNLDVQKKELQQALQILRYVGMAERRASGFEETVEGDLKDLYAKLTT